MESITKEKMVDHLANELAKYGVEMRKEDMPNVVTKGVDGYLKQKGISTSTKDLTTPYLILNEYRESFRTI